MLSFECKIVVVRGIAPRRDEKQKQNFNNKLRTATVS